jgi:transcriptional regulator with XRE-family HTH domain
LGIAKQTLQDLERGTGTVGLAIALRVAAELGVTLFTAPPGLKDQVRHWLQERS